MSKIRQQRTADQIQVLLSELFYRQMRDPRLQDVTITQVMIDRELQHANIYVSAMGDESRRQDVMQALTSATGFLRRELAARLRMRSVPELHFHWDLSMAYVDEVNRIFDELEIPPLDEEE